MTVFQAALFIFVVLELVTAASVDEEQLKTDAKDFYMRTLHASSEVLKNLSAFKITFTKILGLQMQQGYLSGVADKSVDRLQIFKRPGYYLVSFHVKINSLGCSYGVYQHRPHKKSSACSGSWETAGIRNDVQVNLVLEHHSWANDRYECRVTLDNVRIAVDFVSLDKGSKCLCCDSYDYSVKKSMEEELNEAIVEYLYYHYKHSHDWMRTNVIKGNCMT